MFKPTPKRPEYHPPPRGDRLGALVEEMKRGDRDRRRDLHEDRARGRLDEGYTEGDIAGFVERLWQAACPGGEEEEDEESVVVGDGSRKRKRGNGRNAIAGDMLRTAAVRIMDQAPGGHGAVLTSRFRTFYVDILPLPEPATGTLWSWLTCSPRRCTTKVMVGLSYIPPFSCLTTAKPTSLDGWSTPASFGRKISRPVLLVPLP